MLSFGRRQLRGFLYRDDTMGHVTDVEYGFSYDEQMLQTRLQARVVDDQGRAAVVDSTTFATTQLEYDPMVYLNEAAVSLEIDGQPGTGWCEFCWNREYFDFARSYVTVYG
jgi:hypothetical protein